MGRKRLRIIDNPVYSETLLALGVRCLSASEMIDAEGHRRFMSVLDDGEEFDARKHAGKTFNKPHNVITSRLNVLYDEGWVDRIDTDPDGKKFVGNQKFYKVNFSKVIDAFCEYAVEQMPESSSLDEHKVVRKGKMPDLRDQVEETIQYRTVEEKKKWLGSRKSRFVNNLWVQILFRMWWEHIYAFVRNPEGIRLSVLFDYLIRTHFGETGIENYDFNPEDVADGFIGSALYEELATEYDADPDVVRDFMLFVMDADGYKFFLARDEVRLVLMAGDKDKRDKYYLSGLNDHSVSRLGFKPIFRPDL